jgi:hypothetical protein
MRRITPWHWAGAVAASMLAAAACADDPPARARDLAAPADDIISGVVAPPAPTTHRSRTIILEPDATRTVRYAVEAAGALSFAVLAPPGTSPRALGLRVVAPDGTELRVAGENGDLSAPRAIGRVRLVDGNVGPAFGLDLWDAVRVDIERPLSGTWTIQSTAREGAGSWVALATDDRGPELAARWTAPTQVVGRECALSVAVDGVAAGAGRIRVAVTAPSGAACPVTLADGMARFVPAETGRHVVRVDVAGAPASERSPRSIGLVVDVGLPARIVTVRREASADGVREAWPVRVDVPLDTAFLGAEVWATIDLAPKPVAWIGSLVPIADGPDGAREATLTFDRRWLVVAGVPEGAPLELRNLRIHDREAWLVRDLVSSLPLGPAALPPAGTQIDLDEMRLGRAGGHPVPISLTSLPGADDAAVGSHALVLVHGYCSSGVTFPPAQFTGQVGVFFDPNQAKSNDAFAQTLLGYTSQFKSFGVAAHSQGGLASLHLYTFYWSGLDWAGPGIGGNTRLIQSVASPYQGTPLAGNLAILGQIFGTGCGAITDLTPDGAVAWLSTIPTWARQRVHYWTTSFEDGPFLDYCNLVTDFFLTDPDDGVIEKIRGQLPGANNMGHVEGWCHTTGMADPPNYTDAVRNAQINAQAAR